MEGFFESSYLVSRLRNTRNLLECIANLIWFLPAVSKTFDAHFREVRCLDALMLRCLDASGDS